MPDETKVFIHVGMHKTGTSFLQNEVFPKIQGINYQRKVDIATHVEKNKINLFSDENLDGGSYRLFNDWKNRYHIANNLKMMFPDAKIIICTRNEKTWLISAWKQYVLSYFGYPFVEYYNKLTKESLDFSSYVSYLQKLFNDVLVLHYEELQEVPNEFVNAIHDFIGVPPVHWTNSRVYPSLTDRQVSAIILFDKIFRSKSLHLALSLLIRMVRKDPTIQKFMEKKV